MPSAWAALTGGGTVLTWLTSSGISRTGRLMTGVAGGLRLLLRGSLMILFDYLFYSSSGLRHSRERHADGSADADELDPAADAAGEEGVAVAGVLPHHLVQLAVELERDDAEQV